MIQDRDGGLEREKERRKQDVGGRKGKRMVRKMKRRRR